MARAIKISRNELIQMFIDFRKSVAWSNCAMASVGYFVNESKSTTKTVTKENGEKERVYSVQKYVKTNICINADYETKIRRIQEKQNEDPNFQSGELIGKEYLYGKNIPVVVSKKNPDNKMLVMIIEGHTKPLVVHYHNGKRIRPTERKELFTPSYFAEKPLAGRGVVSDDNNFFFRTLSFSNIIKMTINKKRYIVEN